jgi:hypothetical protein
LGGLGGQRPPNRDFFGVFPLLKVGLLAVKVLRPSRFRVSNGFSDKLFQLKIFSVFKTEKVLPQFFSHEAVE